jgi:hypothetical protein
MAFMAARFSLIRTSTLFLEEGWVEEWLGKICLEKVDEGESLFIVGCDTYTSAPVPPLQQFVYFLFLIGIVK